MATEGDTVTVVSWSTVWVTLLISFVVGLVFYVFFCRLRGKHATNKDFTLFETRQFQYANRSPPPFPSSNDNDKKKWSLSSSFQWAIDAYRVSDKETLNSVGLDTYMFLRFLRLGTRVSLVGTLLGCIILIPIYATGEENGPETEEFNSITLAHVSQGSPRLWASAICWTIFCLVVLSELDTEWVLYKPLRRDFMAKGDVDTERDYRHAVICENLPPPLRSNHALRLYFEALFPNKVRQVNVLLHAEHLDKLITERQTAVEAYEKAVAWTHAKADKPPPQVKVGGGCGPCGGTTVEAIPHYQAEISRLNNEIDTERASVCAYADSAHLQQADTTDAGDNGGSVLAAGSKFFQSLIVGSGKQKDSSPSMAQGDIVERGDNDTKGDDECHDDAVEVCVTGDTDEDIWDSINDKNATDDDKNRLSTKDDDRVQDTTQINNVEMDGTNNARTGDVDQIEESDEVGLLSNRTAVSDATLHEGQTSSTGFVTFTSLRVKQAAVQCEISGEVDNVDVAPAPIPTGIVWKNALTPLTKQRYASVLATAFWLVGVLFWAVPVAFVTAIANINSILMSIGASPLDTDTFYYGLLSGILPVIALQILLLVLYLGIEACACNVIRCKSMPQVDSYTFFWHQCYQFANLWLILIGGSLFNQIDALLKNPGDVAQLLAAALPGSSPFFLNMMIMGSFLMWGVELSMIASYGVKLVLSVLQPEAMKTQRMLDEEKKPPSIVYGKILPPMIFVMLVAFVYMPIVPLMEVFAFAYFGGWYIVFKHQCLHVYHQQFEGGGLLWSNIFGFIIACLYTAEVIVVAYLGLKESIGPTVFSVIPFVCTIIVHYRLRRHTIGPLKNLSLQAAADIDMKEGELPLSDDDDSSPTAVAVEHQLYGQPCLQASADERKPMPYRRHVEGSESETAPPALAEV